MSTPTIVQVNARRDHLETLTRTKTPFSALSELIWNGFDADADKVSISIDLNVLDTIERIRITDDGTGIPYADAKNAFGNLGGSWKNGTTSTPLKSRNMHGKTGKGRFRAFALGSLVQWITRYRHNGSVKEYSITGDIDSLDSFSIDAESISSSSDPGTEVIISNISQNFRSLLEDDASERLAEEFALYLLMYPSLRLIYQGRHVDPKDAIKRSDILGSVDIQTREGQNESVEIAVIEWNSEQGRTLFFCDACGIPLQSMALRTHTPGFDNYSAYLKSDYFVKLYSQNLLVLSDGDLHEDLTKILDETKIKLREHFRTRAAEEAAALVSNWKERRIYPYEGEARNPVEQAERQVFDIVAVNVNEYLPDFEGTDDKTKRFTLRLLQQAIKQNPDSLQYIFKEILDLPSERQNDLAALLQKTTLTSIITASKVVADRLTFLASLELLLFDRESRRLLKERSQLHRILANETWIFGEEFNLSIDDESLSKVLESHLALLGERTDDNLGVTTPDGSVGIVDLMLSRRIPQPKAEQREHLIIELKRPSVKIDLNVLAQVQKYALTVAIDERFRDTTTRWVFWAVSNDLAPEARKAARQRHRPDGLFYDDDEQQVFIWTKSWGQIIDSCRARLQFFQSQLNYVADHEAGLEYLRKAHDKYIPTHLKKDAV